MKITPLYIFLSCCLLILCMASCKKEIDFEYHEIDRTNQTVEDTVLKMLEIYEAEKKRNNVQESSKNE